MKTTHDKTHKIHDKIRTLYLRLEVDAQDDLLALDGVFSSRKLLCKLTTNVRRNKDSKTGVNSQEETKKGGRVGDRSNQSKKEMIWGSSFSPKV